MKLLKNIYHFSVGTARYKLYYSRYSWLIRKHIAQQIEYRISIMDKECYENGSCKMCGCRTTALQMADKQCPKPCYPKMMNKKEWNQYCKTKGLKFI